MMLSNSHASMVMAAVLVFVGCRASAADGRAFPDYVEKPESWNCYLVDSDLCGITDEELAGWFKQAQTDAGQLDPPKKFSIIATFIQCFSGGFLTEMDSGGVMDFGANSSCKFFEAASIYGAEDRGYYAFAWTTKAKDGAVPEDTDKVITENAHEALDDPDDAIPDNPHKDIEHPQYKWKDSDNNQRPPEKLHADPECDYAIIFAGSVDDTALHDVNYIYDVLTDDYEYDPGDIYILYGNGNDPDPNDDWDVEAEATKGNLQKAIVDDTVFLAKKLKDQGAHQTAQLLFFAADHGGMDAPSVSPSAAIRSARPTPRSTTGSPPTRSRAWSMREATARTARAGKYRPSVTLPIRTSMLSHLTP